MMFVGISALSISCYVSLAFAAPVTDVAVNNPLASFPNIAGPGVYAGFQNVDTDGVYRTYLANGTVIDAARLSGHQINTYLEAITGHVSATELADTTAAFDNVDSAAVPDAQLLNPPEDVKPTELLAQLAAELNISPRDEGPLVKRQAPIPQCTATNQYCINNAGKCTKNNCYCNQVICLQPKI